MTSSIVAPEISGPNPGTCKYHLIWKKGLRRRDSLQDHEMRRLSWIIGVGPKCNHLYPYKREVERNLTQTEKRAL